MVKQKYSKQEVAAFIDAVDRIERAWSDIMRIDGATIINHIGLKEYPFDQSFDEQYFRVIDWMNAVREEATKYGVPLRRGVAYDAR